MAITKNSFQNISLLNLGLLTSLTLLSGLVLSSTKVSGASTTANAAVTVSSACTMTGTLNTPHTATVNPGVYQDSIGKTTFSVICNDPNGFAIYAIGYTGEEYSGTNHTRLVGPNSNTITTGTATSGSTSNWAMKLESNDPGTVNMNIVNGYNNYSAIPDTYTKVAQITSSTASATPATMSSTYATFIASDQTAGTYNGKVKYTMVHPYNAEAPEPTYDMQNLSIDKCPTTSPINVVDVRDGEVYKAQRLADGKCWLLDNLRLDPTTVSLTDLQGKTNASNQTLTYFKNGGGSSPYPASGVSNAWTSSSQNSYNLPYINTASKDITVTSYGAGSGKVGVYYNYCAASAGSYCYPGNSTGNATEDICPAGWKMPTGGFSSEYQALYTAYSSDATNFRNALSTPLSGNFYNGSANDQGTNGNFWSSTRNGNDRMYNLYVNSSDVSPEGGNLRDRGFSMRCLLDS